MKKLESGLKQDKFAIRGPGMVLAMPMEENTESFCARLMALRKEMLAADACEVVENPKRKTQPKTKGPKRPRLRLV